MNSSETTRYRKARGRCTKCAHVLLAERQATGHVTCTACASSSGGRPLQTTPCPRCGTTPRYSNSPYCQRRQAHIRLKTLYGITIGEYEALLAAQGNGCAICSSGYHTRRLAVDHDHKTGLIRGLLCYSYNRGLPWFSDQPKRLHRAAEYLETTF